MNVSGALRVPGDKSISHRSLILGALGNGTSRITRILQSADVHSTAGMLRALGVEVPDLSNDFTLRGVGLHGLRKPGSSLDGGNSGTTTRLMAGVLAACPFDATLIGDASLSRRPMRRVSKPLEGMGARFDLPAHGGLPMTVHGGSLHGIQWESEVASAQVKSAILLAALVAGVEAEVIEHEKTRDHTERMLAARGVSIAVRERVHTTDSTAVALVRTDSIESVDTEVPGDPSSAAFFAALAALADDGELRLQDVCVNETRTGFFRQLTMMGTRVREENRRETGGELVADLIVSPAALHGTTVTRAYVPAMVDELPMLACMATRVNGTTEITGANELRVKESDRIAAVVSNLRAIGADAEELPDGMRITGGRATLRGRVVTEGDHRLAMAFGVLGAAGENAIEIDDRACVNVSYPGFWDDLERVCRR
ncbi:MAG TPA: 3-phosphoshikimate 1-carboxyvinyltransferase [Gemmatimonadaceae bacterium]